MADHPLKGHFDESRAAWRRAEGSTIEIAFVDDLIGMRNAEDQDGEILIFTEAEWDAFVLGARDGEFDPEAFDNATDT
jgi:hypothetical protein